MIVIIKARLNATEEIFEFDLPMLPRIHEEIIFRASKNKDEREISHTDEALNILADRTFIVTNITYLVNEGGEGTTCIVLCCMELSDFKQTMGLNNRR